MRTDVNKSTDKNDVHLRSALVLMEVFRETNRLLQDKQRHLKKTSGFLMFLLFETALKNTVKIAIYYCNLK